MLTVEADKHRSVTDHNVLLDQVLGLLPQLDSAQLEEVRNHVSALESLGSAPSTRDDWLLQGILTELQDRGLAEMVPERLRLTNRRQYHGYVDKSARTRTFLENHMPNLSRTERTQLGQLTARCLADFIAEFRSVSLAGMLQSVDLVPAAIEESFPGYLRSGRLSAVLRGLSRAADKIQR